MSFVNHIILHLIRTSIFLQKIEFIEQNKHVLNKSQFIAKKNYTSYLKFIITSNENLSDYYVIIESYAGIDKGFLHIT